MLKAQDIVILLKMLSRLALPKAISGELMFQSKLAVHLCMSASEVNAGISRLIQSGLISEDYVNSLSTAGRKIFLPIKIACEECLVYGVKYFFPAEFGVYTRGIATSYASPFFEKLLMVGEDPIPVWPYAEGGQRGLALEPLYRSVPKSIFKYPDPLFYELLVLIDAIRSGRARERGIAIKLLKEKLA